MSDDTQSTIDETAAASGRVRNIVLCSDGTGNRGGKGQGTNVWRLYNAVDLHGFRHNPSVPEQITFYDDGVGTDDNKIWRAVTGAMGLGLSRNIRQLYEFLAKTYRPGDRIYLFGFSRGAFTVRSLAGMICKCGLIDATDKSTEQIHDLVGKAFKAYRGSWRQEKGQTAADGFRKQYGRAGVEIHFIGVWDTVGAIGVPVDELRDLINVFYPIKFHSQGLHDDVLFGAHALAIDDERRSFHPVMWDEAGRDLGTIEQVWFPGVHSNVGGGYPKQGMAHVALDWMMAKAADHGLVFEDSAFDEARRQANIHDRLYDSRSGKAAYYRYSPRNIDKLSRDNCQGPAKIHISALERIDQGTFRYGPGNFPRDSEIVLTGGGSPWGDVDEKGLDTLKDHLADRKQNNAKHLQAAKRWIPFRKGLHAAFVLASLGVVAGAVASITWPISPGTPLPNLDWLAKTVAFLVPESPEKVVKSMAAYLYLHPARLVVAAGVVALLFILRGLFRWRMRVALNRFWDAVRPLGVHRLYVNRPPTEEKVKKTA